jgi:hypothetical protein
MLEIFCGLFDEKIVAKDVKSFSNKGNLFFLFFFVVRQKDLLQTFYSFSSLFTRPKARTSDLSEVIQPKSCESFYVHKENHIKTVDRSKMNEWNDQKLLPNRFFLNQSFLGCEMAAS